MGLLQNLLIGVGLRVALFSFHDIADTVGSRFEFSTALTRFSEVRQEIHWSSAEGAHRPPLVTLLVKLGLMSNPLFFILLDCMIAAVLFFSVKEHARKHAGPRMKETELIERWQEHGRPRLYSDGGNVVIVGEKDDDNDWAATSAKTETGDVSWENLPETIVSLYLLSPFTILTCVARSFAPLTFFFAMLAILCAQLQKPWLAGASLAVTCYLDGPSYLATLGVSVLVMSYERNFQVVQAMLAFALSCISLLYVSYLVEEKNWKFIESAYIWVFFVPDSRPNVGMWWYLMAEVFDRYRSYFLIILHSFIYLCTTVTSATLSARPLLLAHFNLAMLHTFQPYPELFHVFTTLIVLFMHPQFTLLIPGLAPILLVACFSLALQPVMLYTWLDLGSGNANYYYFQCLIVNGMLCTILLQFYLGVVTRDAVLRRITTFLTREKNE